MAVRVEARKLSEYTQSWKMAGQRPARHRKTTQKNRTQQHHAPLVYVFYLSKMAVRVEARKLSENTQSWKMEDFYIIWNLHVENKYIQCIL